MDDLHPDGGEQGDVREARRRAAARERADTVQAARRAPRSSVACRHAARGEGHEQSAREGQDRVRDPQLHQEVRGGRDVLGEAAEDRLRGVEGVAERRHGPALADADERDRGGRERPAEALHGRGDEAGLARAPVGRQRQAGQQDEGVREVPGHEEGAAHGVVLADEPEEDEPGPDRGLGEDEERQTRRPRGGPGGPPASRGRPTRTGPATRRSATPLVARCVNSTIVSRAGERGTSSPLHRGQCAPQPAPEPVARTKAPHRITATFQTRTSQANRARRATASLLRPRRQAFSSLSYQLNFRNTEVPSVTAAIVAAHRQSRSTM